MYSGAYPQSLFASRLPKTNCFLKPKEISATALVIFLETNSSPLSGDS